MNKCLYRRAPDTTGSERPQVAGEKDGCGRTKRAQAAMPRGGQPRWWALPQPAPWGSVPLQARGHSRDGGGSLPCHCDHSSAWRCV